MWYLIKVLEDKIRHRSSLHRCKRCRMLFSKTLETCPYCTQLDDESLAHQLGQRSSFRLSLGRAMLIGAFIILVIMLLAL